MNNTNSLVILCPGQGAQHVGMGKRWADASPAASATFTEADAVLDMPLSRVCFEGPEEQLNNTDFAQAAIYVSSVAAVRGLVEQGKMGLENLVAAAGLSLGEYTALHLAGVFDFATGLRLVYQRGQFMQEAALESEGGMVALIGADEGQAEQVCAAARSEEEVLVPANFNAPGQIVLSGAKNACQRALAAAEGIGVRATVLSVAGAFHSPLMRPAAQRMAEVLKATHFAEPKVPVPSNVTGEPHGSLVQEIKRLLVDQITSSVRWEQNVRWLLANKPGRYVEPAPGRVLSGLMRRIDRAVKVENYAEPG